MRKRHWITAGTGITLLLTSCQPNRPKQANLQPAPPSLDQPVVPPKLPPKLTTLPTIKVPGMLQTSEQLALQPVVNSSTRDPFAAPTIPGTLKATIQPVTSSPTVVKSSIAAQPVANLPQPIIRYNPIPQPVLIPQRVPLPALPSAQPAPAVSRTHLADAIALTGIIQTGSKLSAIVEDTDGSSRYVQVGESLANGQVTVKKINLNSAGNPSIVLVQNGVELTKLVGRSDG